jgi:hypothetical protein
VSSFYLDDVTVSDFDGHHEVGLLDVLLDGDERLVEVEHDRELIHP